MKKPTTRSINAMLKTIQDDGGGVLRLQVTSRAETMALAVFAMAGDDAAGTRILLIANLLKQVPRNKPLCLLCDRSPSVQQIQAVCTLHGERDDPSGAIANVICGHCYDRFGSMPELTGAVRAYYLANVEGVRAIEISDQSGSA